MKQILSNLVVAVMAVLAPIQSIMIVVAILIGADFITGIMKAYKLKEAITSRALARSIYKMCFYQLAVLSAFLLETYLIPGVLPVTKLVAGVIGLTEFLSILENTQKVTGVDLKGVIAMIQSRKDK